MFSVRDDSTDHIGLSLRGDGDIDHLDLWISQEIIERGINSGEMMKLGDFVRTRSRAGGETDDLEARFKVGGDMAITGDETSADKTNPKLVEIVIERDFVFERGIERHDVGVWLWV